MKEESKDFLVTIRMNFDEKEKIKNRAKKTGKNLSSFMRESALGCNIKEKPNEDFYKKIINPMNNFIRTLSELERIAYYEKFIDERILHQEIEDWRKFRTDIKRNFL